MKHGIRRCHGPSSTSAILRHASTVHAVQTTDESEAGLALHRSSAAWEDAVMWPGASAALLVGLILAQSTQMQDCRSDPPPAPMPPPSTGTPPADGFATQDGVRLRVEVAATNVEVPWSMAFAPDGRLFVTERPGRVRILNFATGTSELALTMDDTFAQGEAGALGLALDPDFGTSRLVYVYYTAR